MGNDGITFELALLVLCVVIFGALFYAGLDAIASELKRLNPPKPPEEKP